MLRIWAECRISDLETFIFNVVKGEENLKLILRSYPRETCSSKRNLETKSEFVMATKKKNTRRILDRTIQLKYMQTSKPCLTDNAICVYYKDKSGNSV